MGEVCTNVPETRCRKVPSEKCTEVPVEKCQQVPEQKCTQALVQKCWDEPKEHCTEKTERVQKRVCEDLTVKTLPKVEAVKKALPSKAKATKKALPKATPSYRW